MTLPVILPFGKITSPQGDIRFISLREIQKSLRIFGGRVMTLPYKGVYSAPIRIFASSELASRIWLITFLADRF